MSLLGLFEGTHQTNFSSSITRGSLQHNKIHLWKYRLWLILWPFEQCSHFVMFQMTMCHSSNKFSMWSNHGDERFSHLSLVVSFSNFVYDHSQPMSLASPMWNAISNKIFDHAKMPLLDPNIVLSKMFLCSLDSIGSLGVFYTNQLMLIK